MKKIFLLASSIFVFLVLLGSVEANDNMSTADLISIITPVTSATVTAADDANYTMNVSNLNGEEILNCTFYAYSTSTANSSWSQIGSTIVNSSGNQTYFTIGLDYTNKTTVAPDYGKFLEDSHDYYFTANCTNQTNGVYYLTTPNSGITVDYTTPNTPTSLSPADNNVEKDKKVTFSATVVDENTTNCILHLGARTYGMTYSATSCEYTVSNIPEQKYTWYIEASDSTSSTGSDERSLTIDVPTTSGKLRYLANLPGVKVTGPRTLSFATDVLTNGWTWIIIVAILVVMAYYYKGKRR